MEKVNEKEKTESNEFKKWLETIPVGDYKGLKKLIIEKCITKDYIFRNWKIGVTEVPPLERSVINEIAKEYNQTECFKTTEP